MACGLTFDDVDGIPPTEIAAKRDGFWKQKLDLIRLYTQDGKPRYEFVKDRPYPWPFGE